MASLSLGLLWFGHQDAWCGHHRNCPRYSRQHPCPTPPRSSHRMAGGSNGHICLDILYSGRNGGWSPALTMSKVRVGVVRNRGVAAAVGWAWVFE